MATSKKTPRKGTKSAAGAARSGAPMQALTVESIDGGLVVGSADVEFELRIQGLPAAQRDALAAYLCSQGETLQFTFQMRRPRTTNLAAAADEGAGSATPPEQAASSSGSRGSTKDAGSGATPRKAKGKVASKGKGKADR